MWYTPWHYTIQFHTTRNQEQVYGAEDLCILQRLFCFYTLFAYDVVPEHIIMLFYLYQFRQEKKNTFSGNTSQLKE